MNDAISYQRFDPRKDVDLLPSVIECYRNVFSAEPWNEWKKCDICGKKWGVTEQSLLDSLGFMHCGHEVADFWPNVVVKDNLLHEVTPGASCWVAMDDNNVIGFCWGYSINLKDLEEELELDGVQEYIRDVFGNVSVVAYQDEVGVDIHYRRRGIAKEMFFRRLRDFLDQKLFVGVIRTKTNPPSVTYTWYQRIGYQVIAEYNDADGRVIMARSLTDLDFGR